MRVSGSVASDRRDVAGPDEKIGKRSLNLLRPVFAPKGRCRNAAFPRLRFLAGRGLLQLARPNSGAALKAAISGDRVLHEESASERLTYDGGNVAA